MKHRSRLAGGRAIVLALSVLALAALACGGSVEPTATPLPRPTQKPVATATQPPEPTDRPDPTDRPEATPTRGTQGTGEFTLASEPYEHKSGAFTILLPEGWEVDEKNYILTVTSPDAVVLFEISYINVGVRFSDEELNTFIQAIEDNYFATFPNYAVGEFEPQPDGSILVYKTLDIDNGPPQVVFSYYQQEGNIIYEQDYWVDEDAMDVYSDGLLEVANSMTFDPAAAEEAPLYSIIYTFTGPNDYFEFSAPHGWTYSTETDGPQIIDTFLAPNSGSLIENITYDDGQPVDDLPGFTRDALAARYDVDDLTVEGEEDQPDGSVLLSWTSPSQDLSGRTFYETRGNAVLLLTWLVPTDDFDLYAPVWSTIIDSYVIPSAE